MIEKHPIAGVRMSGRTPIPNADEMRNTLPADDSVQKSNARVSRLITNIVRVAVLAGMVGSGVTAHAGQRTTVSLSDAIVAQTPPDVTGQTYPNFGPPEAPVVADRFGSAVVGETYPRLINPPTIGPEAIGRAPSGNGRAPPMRRNAAGDLNSIVRSSGNFQPQMGD